jgi:diguanylate cyclase (GGDEF)-like protein/PAS domain S-box-containing protein
MGVINPKSATKMVVHSENALLQELRVHQLELEMQNEVLQRTNAALDESHQRYLELYDFAPVGYLSLSIDGLIKEANLTCANLFKTARQKLISLRFSSFIAPVDGDRWYLYFLRALKYDKQQIIELTIKCGDGNEFLAQLVLQHRITDDKASMLRITLMDISESQQLKKLKVALKKLKVAEQQLCIAAKVFEVQEGIVITDANNIILRVNNAFTLITGYTEKEVVGKTPHILSSDRHSEDFYAGMWNSINEDGQWEGEVWNRHKNGNIYLEYLSVAEIQDINGNVINYIGTLLDITINNESANKISHLAFYDSLTNLPNRSLLQDRLILALASSQRNAQYGGLMFIDLDNFKTLNDTLGHNMGDLLLQQVAERLIVCIREDDTVARFGGDEFVVMVENLSEDVNEALVQIESIGNKILDAFAPLHLLATHNYKNSSSIGITLFIGQEQTADELLKQADMAMYHAKESGRNTLRFFDPQMQANIEKRVLLEKDLQLALQENQFILYYQPQVLHNQRIIGVEALIRWQHPQRGLVFPMEFISSTEVTGLILPLGQWVLETACAQIKIWEGSAHTQHLQIAVNVSARQFYQPEFVAQVLQTINKHAINPTKLKLELTESMVFTDIDDTIFKMNAIRKIGVCFSMDDFGTGYSSLSSLKRLPLNQLKIDQSFVRYITSDPNDAIIVQTIIAMTKSFGIDVIAEGVETEEQRAFLELYGCPVLQGYLFGKPMPIEQLEELLNKN